MVRMEKTTLKRRRKKRFTIESGSIVTDEVSSMEVRKMRENKRKTGPDLHVNFIAKRKIDQLEILI